MRRAPCGYCGCNLVEDLPIAYRKMCQGARPLDTYKLRGQPVCRVGSVLHRFYESLTGTAWFLQDFYFIIKFVKSLQRR